MIDPNPVNKLLRKATQGMFWSLAENFGLQFMQLLISIVLARLLLPEQFGLIGMLTLFIALAQSLLDSGFGSALVQKTDADQLDACSVFYFNLVFGVVIVVLLWLAAPLIAKFYAQPVLIGLTRFLSLNILINAFRLVPSALLTKRMDFKVMFKISLAAVIVSGGVGVVLALIGVGVWSLAIQSVLDTLIRTLLVWLASRWRPIRIFSLNALRTMFSFGSRLLLSGLLDTFFTNIYQLFIGKVYSAVDLGYYVRAQGIQVAAVQSTGISLGRVMFPAMSPLKDDKVNLKQAYRKTISTTTFFHFPLIIGLIALAEPLITLLMTERWAPSIPYFQLLCVAGLLYPLHVLNLNILKVVGRSDLFFRLEVIKKVNIVLALFITYQWGILALLYGQIATSVLAYVLNSFFSGKLVGYSLTQQIRDIYPYFLMSLLMGGGMYWAGTAISPLLYRLVAQSALGLAIYIGLNHLTGNQILPEVLRLFKQAIIPAAS